MATNFTATLNISRALFPLLRPGARVVNVASFVGLLSKYGPAVKVNILYYKALYNGHIHVHVHFKVMV